MPIQCAGQDLDVRWYWKRRLDLRPGDRVIITAFTFKGQPGTLLRPARLPNGKPAWLVQLDKQLPLARRGRVRVGDRALEAAPAPDL